MDIKINLLSRYNIIGTSFYKNVKNYLLLHVRIPNKTLILSKTDKYFENFE